MKRSVGGASRHADLAPADSRLLAIAADQLKEFGPKHITVVGIADAAGMTHANVYRYFANKAALIDAVAGQWLRGMEATIAEIADSPDPADDKLERLIQAWARVPGGASPTPRKWRPMPASTSACSRISPGRTRAAGPRGSMC